MAEPVYRRVVIKLSGEYFSGPHPFGMDHPTIDRIAGDLIAAKQLGVEVAVVVGGGNMVRGVEVSSRGVSLPTGDTMGMLATVMNCLALEAAIERRGAPARTLSAFVMPQICELFTRGAAHKYLAEGRIVLLGGRNRRAGRAEGHQCRWRLQRRSQERPFGETVRPSDPFTGD